MSEILLRKPINSRRKDDSLYLYDWSCRIHLFLTRNIPSQPRNCFVL